MGKGGVGLKEQRAAGLEGAGGIACDGAVEEQRVMVGHEQSRGRLMVEHVAVHRRTLAVEHIGRIAHYEVPPLLVGGRTQGVLLTKHHTGAELPRVLLCRVKGLAREVPRLHFRPRNVEREGHGETSAAGPDVEHTGARLRRCHRPVCQVLGLGARNEHPWSHGEASPTKPCLTKHILHRLRFFQTQHDFLKPHGVFCR